MGQFKFTELSNVIQTYFLQYRNCLVKIISKTSDGTIDIGTGFHIGDGYIVTAKHVIENGIQEIKAYYKNKDVNHTTIYVHKNDNIDIAILKTDFSLNDYLESVELEKLPSRADRIPFNKMISNKDLTDKWILQKVLLMGFPPIPLTDDAYIVATEGEINAIVNSYLTQEKHIVISNMPRGGFSGGPVISQYGYVLGVLIQAFGEKDKEYEVGYAAAISTDAVLSILMENNITI